MLGSVAYFSSHSTSHQVLSILMWVQCVLTSARSDLQQFIVVGSKTISSDSLVFRSGIKV